MSKALREANHDINRMNAEKITFTELSMTKLQDMMMSILFEQAEGIRKVRPVTAEDMINIVVNYLAQTGLDDKTLELPKKLCMQRFEDIE